MGYGISNLIVNPAGGAIATDMDPNGSPPLEPRIFQTPSRTSDRADLGIFLYAAPTGGMDITVQIWAFDRELNRWFARGGAVACPADVMTTLVNTSPAVPDGATLFAQVTANNGVTRLGIGAYESR